MVEERRVLLEGSTVLRISPPSGGLSVAREREGGMERERMQAVWSESTLDS